MYEAISKHRASDMLDRIGVGRIVAADPKDHATQDAVASLERSARFTPIVPSEAFNESQWELAAAFGGVAVIELPSENIESSAMDQASEEPDG